jgi:hypothetical protein
MVLAILSILVMWLWLWLVFCGWGSMVFRISGCQRDDTESLLVTPWVGVAAVIALLPMWHFAAPINEWAIAVVSAVGIFASASVGRHLLARLMTTCRQYPKQLAIALLFIL